MTPTPPTLLPSNFQIDDGVALDARLEASVRRMASALKEGEFGRINADGRDYFLHRSAAGYRLTSERGAVAPAQMTIAQIGPILWREIEAGAATPELRRALARGMTARLPGCGCAHHWAAALAGLTDEDCATAESFHRWQWGEHQKIAKRLGKLEWPYPGPEK